MNSYINDPNREASLVPGHKNDIRIVKHLRRVGSLAEANIRASVAPPRRVKHIHLLEMKPLDLLLDLVGERVRTHQARRCHCRLMMTETLGRVQVTTEATAARAAAHGVHHPTAHLRAHHLVLKETDHGAHN